ncbi:hypothetical protein NIES3275_77210 (plasmid) [Microchaete diplosiphon NIES-3275]|nr:hypothetical protein NIES3275_77210 [Microchaete diplosiphon NIES-3275]
MDIKAITIQSSLFSELRIEKYLYVTKKYSVKKIIYIVITRADYQKLQHNKL